MHLHSNAATCPRQRELIRRSPLPYRTLAQQLDISLATVHHWKHQENAKDRSCRPHVTHYALDDQEEQLVLWLRRTGRLPLDDLLEAVQEILPHARRASLHRLLVRQGCNRFPSKQQQSTGEPGVFKEYGPGFVHIDCFYLPKLEGQKYYCFVAIDRATRLVYLRVYTHKNKEAATDFLKHCLEFFPFQLHKILTDNGREFTLATFKNRWGSGAKKLHPFTDLCQQNQIEHRQTKPYTPKTNGMVERTNGLIKEGTTKQHRYQNLMEMQQDLHHWFTHYNFHRRHRRLGRITPYQAACQWYEKQPEIFKRKPTELLAYCSQSSET